jgi:hypothetical protein
MKHKLDNHQPARACFCIGPQNGEPYCPCQMRSLGIIQRDGRWVQPEKDLGPVLKSWSEG